MATSALIALLLVVPVATTGGAIDASIPPQAPSIAPVTPALADDGNDTDEEVGLAWKVRDYLPWNIVKDQIRGRFPTGIRWPRVERVAEEVDEELGLMGRPTDLRQLMRDFPDRVTTGSGGHMIFSDDTDEGAHVTRNAGSSEPPRPIMRKTRSLQDQ